MNISTLIVKKSERVIQGARKIWLKRNVYGKSINLHLQKMVDRDSYNFLFIEKQRVLSLKLSKDLLISQRPPSPFLPFITQTRKAS